MRPDEDFGSAARRVAAAVAAGLQIVFSLPLQGLAAPFAQPPVAQRATEKGPFEEVWEFTNKFSLDRTHNNHDWAALHKEFAAKVLAAGDREGELAVTREMLKLLGDKYTRLLDANSYAALSRFDMLGAGVMLSPNKEGKLAVASAPPPGSAAAGKGVRKGDLVTAINGRPTMKMTSFDVIDFLSKYQGSTVSFELVTPGAAQAVDGGGSGESGSFASSPGEARTVTLERTFQKVKNPVKYELQEGDDGHTVGYMAVSEFNSVVTEKVRAALAALTASGADEFVLDLRGNGGGAFQSALGLAGVFMDGAPITQVVDGDGKRIGFSTENDAVTTAPLVVWIDGGSASASEVLAGALHDDCRAVLVGSRSYGKGIIQAVYGLSDGSGLVLTVARYETPRGTDIQGSGITPDIEVAWPAFLPKVGRKVPQEAFNLAVERSKTCPPIAPLAGAASSPAAAPAAAPAPQG